MESSEETELVSFSKSRYFKSTPGDMVSFPRGSVSSWRVSFFKSATFNDGRCLLQEGAFQVGRVSSRGVFQADAG